MSGLSWLQGMLSHEFMRSAFIGGGGVAIGSGTAGYFLVVRGQVFAVDALSHVAFTGALAALAFGLDERLGLIVVTLGAALVLGSMAGLGRAGDVAVGAFFAWILGLGVLFLSIYVSSRSTGNGTGGVAVLFGSVLGISPNLALVSGLAGIGVAAGMAAIARPLLFASVDPAVAAAAGVPVGLLGLLLMALIGTIAAEAVQVIGALLILGLLATPGAIARALTARPYMAMLLSGAVALLAVWAGLTVSYAVSWMPPSFAIIGLLFAGYLIATFAPAVAARRPGSPL